MRTKWGRWFRVTGCTAFGLGFSLFVETSPAAACVGDCDQDGAVTIDELVRSVGIALEIVSWAECPEIDANADGQVTVDELVIGVDNAARGCPTRTPQISTSPERPTLTPTPTAPPTRTNSISATAIPSVTPTAPLQPTTPTTPHPFFVDVTEQAGSTYTQFIVPSPPPFREADFFTGGAAVGDYDLDGHPDLYVTRLTGYGILFRNQGDGTFVDVTAHVGLDLLAVASNGAAWVDIDNDGDQDLYVTGFGTDARRNFLFLNERERGFREVGVERGAAVAGAIPLFGFSAAAGDYDQDGWLDLHVTGFRLETSGRPRIEPGARLLRNLGSGWFEDVTVAAGVAVDNVPSPLPVAAPSGVSYASHFTDLDNDGWPDLLIVSDFGTSRLFWNNQDGTFSDGTVAAGVGTDENGMGSTVADYDGDGLFDWFVTAIDDPLDVCHSFRDCRWGTRGNRLYRNLGNRSFADVTDAAGVRHGGWGWGAAFLDYDNDGEQDLVMTNGVEFPFLPLVGSPFDEVDDQFVADPMRLWKGAGGSFVEVAVEAGLTDQGLGKGLVVLDFDSDGDLDLFIVRTAQTPILYRNERGSQNGWLRVEVIGSESNRSGLGARVTVLPTEGSAAQTREIGSSSHFLGQGEATAHFGLGSGDGAVAEVRVDWPKSGRRQVLRDVQRNQRIVVVESD